jgi:hypothetical protein
MYKPGDFSFNTTDQQAVLKAIYCAIDNSKAWEELSLEFGRDNFSLNHISFKLIKQVYISISEKFGHTNCRQGLCDIQYIARYSWNDYVKRYFLSTNVDLQEPQQLIDDENGQFKPIYTDEPFLTRSTFVSSAVVEEQAINASIAASMYASKPECDDPICY